MGKLIIGTRGSKLALRQAHWVAARLRELGHAPSIQVIVTTGDRAGSVPLAALGKREGVKGIFTKEIEKALLAGEIDLAVHSLKDLPTELDSRLALGCVPSREDPRDALVGLSTAELARGGVVGTGSRRRAEQLRSLLPAVTVTGIRGNVDTRIRKLRAGRFDAIVLAAAGLARMGRSDEVAEFLGTDRMVPAAGQGALGIEVRAGDAPVLEAIVALHDPAASAEVQAERSLLRAIGGGCDVPVGVYASCLEERLEIVAAAPRPEGGIARARNSGQARDASALGRELAEALRRRGAALP